MTIPLLPAPSQPVALLPPPIGPVARLASRRRAGGEMIRALLASRGIYVNRVVRHKDGTFTAAIFSYRISAIADQVAATLAKYLRFIGFHVIKHGADYYTGLMFGGVRTPMVTFALSRNDAPEKWQPEKWLTTRHAA